ncbi:MAG: hypothetical protein ACSLEM_05205 [Candidatus Malihini olakiniferum]
MAIKRARYSAQEYQYCYFDALAGLNVEELTTVAGTLRKGVFYCC